MKQVYPITIQSGMSQSGSYILMLCEPESNLQIPIIIGQHEAQSILLAKEAVPTGRPMTHALIKNLMDTYGLELQKVTIDRVNDGIFFATLHLGDSLSLWAGANSNDKTLDSRTSDAITLALLCDAPIFVDDKVLEETGVKTQADDQPDTIENLEQELRRCEENEEYEKAAEIQKKIDAMKHQES